MSEDRVDDRCRAEPVDPGLLEGRVGRPSPTTRARIAWIARLAVFLVLPVAISAAGAFVVASRSEPVYAARSEVIFDLRDLGWDAAERFLATQVVVARSRPLLASVAGTFGVPIDQLERNLSVEALRNSEVIRLEYASRTRAQALEVARVLTELYLSTSRELALSPGNAGPRTLTPAFVLGEPVSPKPLRVAAIGAGAGVALATAAAAVLGARLWRLP